MQPLAERARSLKFLIFGLFLTRMQRTKKQSHKPINFVNFACLGACWFVGFSKLWVQNTRSTGGTPGQELLQFSLRDWWNFFEIPASTENLSFCSEGLDDDFYMRPSSSGDLIIKYGLFSS